MKTPFLSARTVVAAALGLAWALPAAGPLPRIRVAADPPRLVTAAGQPVRWFGVNYFRPGTGWAPRVWKEFDPEATRRDFARLKALGANCVRVFLTYGSFMSEPGVVSETGLRKLDQFLELAETAGLYVHPTGPDHWEGLPVWARTDRIADEMVLRALEGFWHAVAARYRGRSVILGYDLLNEPAVGWDTPAMRPKWQAWLRRQYGDVAKTAAAWGVPAGELEAGRIAAPKKDAPPGRRLLDYQHFRESLAEEWTRRQAAVIHAADPEALVTVGLIQWSVPVQLAAPWQYSGFRPSQQARWLDFLDVHFYPLARGFYEYHDAEDEARNLAYLRAVVDEVARAGKPVVLAEFGWYGGGRLTIDGGKHPPATEAQQARWCRRVIETTADVCQGWLNWGLYDHPEARDVTQLLGLLTADGREKAWGRTFRELAGRYRETPPGNRPNPNLPVLDWDQCLQDKRAVDAFRESHYQAWKREQGAGR